MIRAVIYTRVSTKEQGLEGYSLDSQEERCRKFIISQGWDCVQVYSDSGYTAKNMKRPALRQLLNDVKENQFDAVVFYRMDRFARNVLNFLSMMELFDKHQVTLHSTMEPIETKTAHGRFLITNQAAMAQMESELTAERVLHNMQKKAELGERNGSTAPFGYDLIEGKLYINEKEAKIVVRIYEMYLTMGMHSIARELNNEGISTKNGGMWHIYPIKYILENPVYVGKMRWAYRNSSQIDPIITDSDHPRIMTDELFDAVQGKRMERYQATGAKALTGDYPFSGVLKCPRCGGPMSGRAQSNRGLRYYRCIKFKSAAGCDMPDMNEKSVEYALFKQMNWVPLLDWEPKQNKNDISEEEIKKGLEKEKDKLEKKMKRWRTLWAEEEITFEELKEYTEEDKKRIKEIEERLSTLQIPKVKKPTISKDEFMQRVQSVSDLWEYMSHTERKTFIHSLFKKIVIEFIPGEKFVSTDGRKRLKAVQIVDYELKY